MADYYRNSFIYQNMKNNQDWLGMTDEDIEKSKSGYYLRYDHPVFSVEDFIYLNECLDFWNVEEKPDIYWDFILTLEYEEIQEMQENENLIDGIISYLERNPDKEVSETIKENMLKKYKIKSSLGFLLVKTKEISKLYYKGNLFEEGKIKDFVDNPEKMSILYENGDIYNYRYNYDTHSFDKNGKVEGNFDAIYKDGGIFIFINFDKNYLVKRDYSNKFNRYDLLKNKPKIFINPDLYINQEGFLIQKTRSNFFHNKKYKDVKKYGNNFIALRENGYIDVAYEHDYDDNTMNSTKYFFNTIEGNFSNILLSHYYILATDKDNFLNIYSYSKTIVSTKKIDIKIKKADIYYNTIFAITERNELIKFKIGSNDLIIVENKISDFDLNGSNLSYVKFNGQIYTEDNFSNIVINFNKS